MLVNFLLSAARTLLPLVAAGIMAAAGYLGLPINGETAAALATLGLAAAWWLTGRLLELAGTRLGWPWLRRLGGVMIGWARQPQYRRNDGRPDLGKMGRAIRNGRNTLEG